MIEEIILYSLILVPLAFYALAFGYETYMSIARLVGNAYSRGATYVHATWEVTHTLLVYSFVIFITTHSNMLPQLAPVMFVPVSIVATLLMIRAALYLYLFYGEENPRAARLLHSLFAVCHIVPFMALIWGFIAVYGTVSRLSLEPMTDNLWIIFAGLVITASFCAIPLARLYASYRDKN